MLTAPNIITFIRLLLVPVMIHLLVEQRYLFALVVFVGAALSDALDGFLARALDQRSQLGAVLDPAADKLMMLGTTLTLTWIGLLPVWVAAAIVLRDAVIVGGFLAYRWLRGRVEMAPTWLGKFNTFLQFGVLSLVIASAAGVIAAGVWLKAMFVLLVGAIIASGLHYVWVWSMKATRPERGH